MVIEEYFKRLWWERDINIPNVSLDDNAFPAFLEIDLRGDELEIPFFLLKPALQAKARGYDKLAFNLVNGSDREGRRTFHHKTVSTILKKFSDASGSSMRIAHVVTSKNLHYYGNWGIILDQNYSPLFVATVKVRLVTDGTPRLSHPMCKLSYKVFENSQEIVEKTIIKQAIPLFSTYRVDVCFGTFYSRGSVELAITNLESMVVIPNRPTLISSSVTAFNQTILINCDNQ